MRKFKLLKDLPDCPRGAIAETDVSVATWYGKDGRTSYTIYFILSHPDWFEEVVEQKEIFSKYPCCMAAHWSGSPCPIHGKPTPKKIRVLHNGFGLIDVGDKVEEIITILNEMRGI